MGNRTFQSQGLQPLIAKGCAGEVSPDAAWEVLSSDLSAILVDVRTAPEWALVGTPNLTSISKQAIFVPWREFPTMEINKNFVDEVVAENKLGEEDPIFFLCKTGGRSLDAAIELTKHGYKHCYNILGGFEGDIDANGHRGNKNGWKKSNLPWEQR
ncbi:MAG: rhodanese-like protein [Rickettsiaceae bacterium]|jgi:rhodanese-related sulfurtransferase|nr:rhodanese-like protein [Rickettsiaceae bacterium]